MILSHYWKLLKNIITWPTIINTKTIIDYNLALHLLNKKYYMTNGSILLIEDPAIFSPISQLNYEFYSNNDDLTVKLPAEHDLQCIVGKSFIPFGQGQSSIYQ